MSQDKEFTQQEKQVVDAWQSADHPDPSPELNAMIQQMAQQQADQVRKPKASVAPFGSGRWAGLSVAASVVFAVTLVVVLKQEHPEEMNLEHVPDLVARDVIKPVPVDQSNKAMEPIVSDLAQKQKSVVAKEEDVGQVEESRIELELASSGMSKQPVTIVTPEQTIAPEAKLEIPSLEVSPEPASIQPSAAIQSAPEVVMDEAPMMAREESKAPAKAIRRKREISSAPKAMSRALEQEPVVTSIRHIFPPLALRNISSDQDLRAQEQRILDRFFEYSQGSKTQWLRLWHIDSYQQLQKLIDDTRWWSAFQEAARGVEIIARIESESGVYFVFNATIGLPVEGDVLYVVDGQLMLIPRDLELWDSDVSQIVNKIR